MKILLDTNIIIHREANKASRPEIGLLFKWIDNLKYSKYIHPITIEELNRFKDSEAKETMNIKVENYNQIKYLAPFNEKISHVSAELDKDLNDQNDTKILNEIYENRIDALISEDKKIHRKAELLSIKEKVFTIQKFLEKVTSENPDLVPYSILAVKQVDFGQVDLSDPFFDSFKEDYSEFEWWFNKKSENPCYICKSDDILSAFLFIKVEDKGEDYSNISPAFKPKKRLKIGTLKVTGNGYKIGERFLKIVFDNAFQYKVDEIYVTVFDKRQEQIQLIEMLEEWGFAYHGIKSTSNGEEKVYIKPFSKKNPIYIENPRISYPFFSKETNKYIIKIEPQYHTELFPDSINTKEDKSLYQENQPHRNRIGKVYISHSPQRDLIKAGDIFLVYRIGESDPKIYSSTITSICIVENIKNDFKDFEDFFNSCNRRTLINREDLLNNWWNKKKNYKPFIINFLYAFSLPTPKPTFKNLIDAKVFENPSSLGVGFYKMDDEQFKKIVKFAYGIK